MKLKICGMKRQADLDCAARLGFDFCGFIFHEKSPRYCEPAAAAKLKTGKMARVGVFLNQEAAEIIKIMRTAKLDYAQLHGAQTERDALRIGKDRVIRVLWPQRYENMDSLRAEAAKWDCALFLLDAGQSGGGSGRSLDWGDLARLDLPAPWLLAGGLGAHNAREALERCSPWGLDFNSCLEDGPGLKNHDKMLAAVLAARQESGQ